MAEAEAAEAPAEAAKAVEAAAAAAELASNVLVFKSSKVNKAAWLPSRNSIWTRDPSSSFFFLLSLFSSSLLLSINSTSKRTRAHGQAKLGARAQNYRCPTQRRPQSTYKRAQTIAHQSNPKPVNSGQILSLCKHIHGGRSWGPSRSLGK